MSHLNSLASGPFFALTTKHKLQARQTKGGRMYESVADICGERNDALYTLSHFSWAWKSVRNRVTAYDGMRGRERDRGREKKSRQKINTRMNPGRQGRLANTIKSLKLGSAGVILPAATSELFLSRAPKQGMGIFLPYNRNRTIPVCISGRWLRLILLVRGHGATLSDNAEYRSRE